MDKPKLMTMPPLTYYSGKNVVVNEEKYDQLHDRILELEAAIKNANDNNQALAKYADRLREAVEWYGTYDPRARDEIQDRVKALEGE